MAETITENQVCHSCGAAVREGALFCYNCGGDLSPSNTAKKDENELVSDVQFRESIFVGNGNHSKQSDLETKREIKEIFNETPIAKPIDKSNPDKETKLESAATIRKKTKSIQPKKVEIIWEEHDNAPNIWFILVAILLTVVAAVILFLAIRIR
jgi:hypothetical protein